MSKTKKRRKQLVRKIRNRLKAKKSAMVMSIFRRLLWIVLKKRCSPVKNRARRLRASGPKKSLHRNLG